MAEYPIHPYIIHCLELLLANAAAPVVLALDGRCGSGKTTMATALAEQFPDSIVLPACGTRCWPRPAPESPCSTEPTPAGRVLICPCSSLPHSHW